MILSMNWKLFIVDCNMILVKLVINMSHITKNSAYPLFSAKRITCSNFVLLHVKNCWGLEVPTIFSGIQVNLNYSLLADQ